MAEMIAAQITLGGNVPESLVPELCRVMTEQGLSVPWEDSYFQPASAEDLCRACTAGEDGKPRLALQDDEARWGEFELLERFLQEHRIGFTRRSEGKWDLDPERVEYRPELGRVTIAINSAGVELVAACELAHVQTLLGKALAAAQTGCLPVALVPLEAASRSLRQCLPSRVPPLEPFQVVPEMIPVAG